jgi:hypothetical protein
MPINAESSPKPKPSLADRMARSPCPHRLLGCRPRRRSHGPRWEGGSAGAAQGQACGSGLGDRPDPRPKAASGRMPGQFDIAQITRAFQRMQKTTSALHVAPRTSGRRRWATTVCQLLSTAFLTLAGCAVAAGGAFASEIPTGCPLAFRSNSSVGPYSELAAQADDASLLAELPLPPGSSESATEPAEDDSLLAHPAIGPPASPNAVDEHTWWLVPVAPAEALSYICAHLPAGTTRPETIGWSPGEPNVPDNEIAVFTPPGSPSTLVIKAVQLPNGSTALRADAQVVWTTPRSASETIPSGAHLLRIAVHDRSRSSRNPQNPSQLALLERLPRQITSPRQIEGIVALLNELRVVQPGRRVCPLLEHGDSSVELTFYVYASPGAVPLAVADIESGTCHGGVSLMIGGVSQPRLVGGWSLVEQIGEALGVNAAAGPPIGAKPRISRVRMSRKRLRIEPEDTVTVGVQPGSEFLFDLSAPAEVSVAISRLPPGVRYAETCSANAGRRTRPMQCRRTVGVARITRLTEPEGEDGITFSGEEGHRALEPGDYVVVLKAHNTGGRSRVASVQFEITR